MQDRIFKELEDFLHEQKKVTDNKNAIQLSKLLEERNNNKQAPHLIPKDGVLLCKIQNIHSIH